MLAQFVTALGTALRLSDGTRVLDAGAACGHNLAVLQARANHGPEPLFRTSAFLLESEPRAQIAAARQWPDAVPPRLSPLLTMQARHGNKLRAMGVDGSLASVRHAGLTITLTQPQP